MVANNGKFLHAKNDVHQIRTPRTHFEEPIKNFVNEHPGEGMSIEEEFPGVVFFDVHVNAKRKLSGECKALMDSLVQSYDELVVEVNSGSIGIYQKMLPAFHTANTSLGLDGKFFLLITEVSGERSLREGASITIEVGGNKVQDTNKLADILDWIVLQY
jgi:hypothetical protein